MKNFEGASFKGWPESATLVIIGLTDLPNIGDRGLVPPPPPAPQPGSSISGLGITDFFVKNGNPLMIKQNHLNSQGFP